MLGADGDKYKPFIQGAIAYQQRTIYDIVSNAVTDFFKNIIAGVLNLTGQSIHAQVINNVESSLAITTANLTRATQNEKFLEKRLQLAQSGLTADTHEYATFLTEEELAKKKFSTDQKAKVDQKNQISISKVIG